MADRRVFQQEETTMAFHSIGKRTSRDLDLRRTTSDSSRAIRLSEQSCQGRPMQINLPRAESWNRNTSQMFTATFPEIRVLPSSITLLVTWKDFRSRLLRRLSNRVTRARNFSAPRLFGSVKATKCDSGKALTRSAEGSTVSDGFRTASFDTFTSCTGSGRATASGTNLSGTTFSECCSSFASCLVGGGSSAGGAFVSGVTPPSPGVPLSSRLGLQIADSYFSTGPTIRNAIQPLMMRRGSQGQSKRLMPPLRQAPSAIWLYENGSRPACSNGECQPAR